MNARSSVLIILAEACIVLTLVSAPLSAGCPPGTVEDGVERVETDTAIIIHHICKPVSTPAPTSDNAALRDSYCSSQRRVAGDQAAIRALGFQSNTEQFEEFAALAKDTRDEFAQKALDAVLSNSLDKGIDFAKEKVDVAKSLNPWNVNTRIAELKAKGLNSELIFKPMRQIAVLRGKPEAAPYVKDFLDQIKVAKEAADAQDEAEKDPSNANLRLLLSALKMVQGDPALGLVVTGAEFGESLAYGYFLNNSVDTLTQMNDDQLKRLDILSRRIKDDVGKLNEAKSAWGVATQNAEPPSCSL
jgi:hypothetical protein